MVLWYGEVDESLFYNSNVITYQFYFRELSSSVGLTNLCAGTAGPIRFKLKRDDLAMHLWVNPSV